MFRVKTCQKILYLKPRGSYINKSNYHNQMAFVIVVEFINIQLIVDESLSQGVPKSNQRNVYENDYVRNAPRVRISHITFIILFSIYLFIIHFYIFFIFSS